MSCSLHRDLIKYDPVTTVTFILQWGENITFVRDVHSFAAVFDLS